VNPGKAIWTIAFSGSAKAIVIAGLLDSTHASIIIEAAVLFPAPAAPANST
jgi:hypothetical protein